MKAIICNRYGPADLLKLDEVPKPSPKNNEVLIKIYATAVTTSDVLIRGLNAPFIYRFLIQLLMGFRKLKNPILGMVLSGVIEKAGKNVSSFNIGDSVFAFGSKSAFRFRFGTYAEYMCLPEDWNLTHKPLNVNFEEAAAIPYGASLALFYLRKMKIQPGHKILIYGASGSVGLSAIQIAKTKGVIITAACSSKNFNLVKLLGADNTIDYTESDAIHKLSKYDYVFDAVGKTKTSNLKILSKKALTINGKYISVDDSTPSISKLDFIHIKNLVEQEKLKPIIDSIFPIEQIVEAHKYVEKGHKRGSVVISVFKI